MSSNNFIFCTDGLQNSIEISFAVSQPKVFKCHSKTTANFVLMLTSASDLSVDPRYAVCWGRRRGNFILLMFYGFPFLGLLGNATVLYCFKVQVSSFQYFLMWREFVQKHDMSIWRIFNLGTKFLWIPGSKTPIRLENKFNYNVVVQKKYIAQV